jgi:hypothetical protein
MRTFEQMATEAEKAGNVHELNLALANMFSRSTGDTFERRSIIAERYVAALERPSPDGRRALNDEMDKGKQADALYFTSDMYLTEGLKHQKHPDAARRLAAEGLLAKAERRLQAAVDLGPAGNVPLSLRLFHLAKAQSAVGKKKEAAGDLRSVDPDGSERVFQGVDGGAETGRAGAREYTGVSPGAGARRRGARSS